MILLTTEDADTMLGLCGYVPAEPDEELAPHCYDLICCGNRGFTYRVLSEPAECDINEGFINERVLPVSMGWIGKREGCDLELELYIALG